MMYPSLIGISPADQVHDLASRHINGPYGTARESLPNTIDMGQ